MKQKKGFPSFYMNKGPFGTYKQVCPPTFIGVILGKKKSNEKTQFKILRCKFFHKFYKLSNNIQHLGSCSDWGVILAPRKMAQRKTKNIVTNGLAITREIGV